MNNKVHPNKGSQPPNPPIGGLKESYWFLSPPDGGFRGLINNEGFGG
jgi:hypothetical protein